MFWAILLIHRFGCITKRMILSILERWGRVEGGREGILLWCWNLVDSLFNSATVVG